MNLVIFKLHICYQCAVESKWTSEFVVNGTKRFIEQSQAVPFQMSLSALRAHICG